jgi:hypothetical protein
LPAVDIRSAALLSRSADRQGFVEGDRGAEKVIGPGVRGLEVKALRPAGHVSLEQVDRSGAAC